MNAKQKLHQAHLAEWAARFSEQKASGLTIRQWCEQNNVSIHKYNYWKHQLKEQFVDQMLPEIVPLSVPTPLSPSDNSISDSSLSRTDHSNRTNYTDENIQLCVDGVALELDEEFPRTLIQAVHYA